MSNPSKYTKITILLLIIFLATTIVLPAIYSHQLIKTARAIDLGPITDISDKAAELAKKYPYMAAFLGLSAALFAACGIAGIKILGTGVEITGICNIVNKILDWLEIHAKNYFNSFLKKKLLEYLTDSIIRWIQGEEGKPLFVTNWSKFLGNVVDESVGEYIKATELAFLCQPFKAQVILNLPMPGRPLLPTCTLNQIVGNIEDFYDDFRNGGWVAYNEMLYPWNNPYGAYLMAFEGEAYEIAKAASDQADETAQSQGGFLTIKRCKPGNEIVDPITNETVCLDYETVTPGNVVAEQVTSALGSSLDFIVNSEDLTVYLTAIADAAINRLMKETLSGGGLSTMSTDNAPEELGTAPPSDYFTMKYSCVSGVCQLDENGEYEGLDACTANCSIEDDGGSNYKCNAENSTCSVDANGDYSTRAACRADCRRFSCTANHTCVLDAYGDYDTKRECNQDCVE